VAQFEHGRSGFSAIKNVPRLHTQRYGVAQLVSLEEVFTHRYEGIRYVCGS
jgi:hypothetical protein